MRLDKFIADTTEFSRSQARKLVAKGRVNINGILCKKADRKVEPTAHVTIDDQQIRYRKNIYLLLNKPKGYVCSTRDPEHPTVLELIPEMHRHREPHAVGRLDIDTTGLVLLTDDGNWSHNLTSPRRNKEKEYQVTTAEPIPESAIRDFRTGFFLEGDDNPTRPATLLIHGPKQATLIIAEGRFHQVKRMFEAIGNTVVLLHRSRIDTLPLPLDLSEGHVRELTAEEIARLSSK